MERAYYERYILSKEKVLPEPIKGLKKSVYGYLCRGIFGYAKNL